MSGACGWHQHNTGREPIVLQKRKHLLATTALAAVVMAIPGVVGAADRTIDLSSSSDTVVQSTAPDSGAGQVASDDVTIQKHASATRTYKVTPDHHTGTITLGADVLAKEITLDLSDGSKVTGVLTSTDKVGVLKFVAKEGASSIAGLVGAGRALREVEITAEAVDASVSEAVNTYKLSIKTGDDRTVTLKSLAIKVSGGSRNDLTLEGKGTLKITNGFDFGNAGMPGSLGKVTTKTDGEGNLVLGTEGAVVESVVGNIGAADKKLNSVTIEATGNNATAQDVYANALRMNAADGKTATVGYAKAGTLVVEGKGTSIVGAGNKGFDLGNVTTTKNGQGKLELRAAVDTVAGGKVTQKGGTVGNIGTPGGRFADVTINATENKAVATGGDVYAKKLTLNAGIERTSSGSGSSVTYSGNAINLGYVGTETLMLDGEGTSRIGRSGDKATGFNIGKVEATGDGKGVLHLYATEGSSIGSIGAAGKSLKDVHLKHGNLRLGTGEVHAKNLHLEANTALLLDGPVKVHGALNAPTQDEATKETFIDESGVSYNYWRAQIVVSQKGIDAANKEGKAVLEANSTSGFTFDSANKKASFYQFGVENTILEGKFKSLSLTNGLSGLAGDDLRLAKSVFNHDYGTILARVTNTLSADGKLVDTVVAPRSDSEIARRLSVSVDEAKAIKAVVRSLGDDAEARVALNMALEKGSDAGNAARQSAVSTVSQANQAINTASRAAADAVTSRLASARTGTDVAGLQQSGTAAGDSTLRNGAWVKAAGSTATQKSRGGVAGNSTNSYGMTIGMDNMVADDVRVGLALSTSKSDMKGKGASQTKTDVTSYQVALYGSYEPEGFFVEGQLAYAQNSVKTSRQITIGGLDRTAKGKYDANQYSASVAAGSPLHRGAVTLTPKAGLSYTYTDPSKYTETGAGAFNMTVDPSATSILEGSLGGSLAYEHKTLRGSVVRPELRAAALYDFIGDDATSTGKYSGDTTLFNTSGLKRSRFGGTIGAGLGYTTADGVWEVRADYDAEMRSGYVGHNGMLTGRVNF